MATKRAKAEGYTGYEVRSPDGDALATAATEDDMVPVAVGAAAKRGGPVEVFHKGRKVFRADVNGGMEWL